MPLKSAPPAMPLGIAFRFPRDLLPGTAAAPRQLEGDLAGSCAAIGVAYQSHGAPLRNVAGLGPEYLISKNSNASQFSAAPNAMSPSKIAQRNCGDYSRGIDRISIDPTIGSCFMF